MSSSDLALYGTEEAPAPSRTLSAGRFSFLLERGQVREFCRDGVELIRGIAFVVRDRGWDTLPLALDDVEIQVEPDRVSVRYRARVQGEAQLDITASIRLDADGYLRFAGTARARGDFETNRTGFIVLYPLQGVAGAPLAVEHADGTVENTHMPRWVAPAQPVFDIRGLRHDPFPGLTLECRLEGEVFEMEDHRNWTDASFKVYSRPLTWPRPYVIGSGTEVRQAVDVTVSGRPRVPAAVADGSAVRMTVGAVAGAVPSFGIAARPEDSTLPAEVLARYGALGLSHLLCPAGRLVADQVIERYAQLLRRLEFRGELALEAVVSGMTPEEEINRIGAAVRQAGVKAAAISLFMEPHLRSYQPTDVWPETAGFDRLYAAGRRAFPDALIGGGSYAFFTELNRLRGAVRGADYVTHTTSPLVHDCDDRSVMQTLEALPDVFATTRSFAGDMTYRVGPISLGLRHNPGGRVEPNPEDRRKVLTDDDPRWRGLFGASWMLGYAAEASRAGLDSVTFGALSGPSALVSLGNDHSWPAGTPLPVFHALSVLATASRRPGFPVAFSRPEVRGFGWLAPDGSRVALAVNNSPARVMLLLRPGWSEALPLLSENATVNRLPEDIPGQFELEPYRALLLSGEVGSYGICN